MKSDTELAPLLEAFFVQRLMGQRKVSAHTLASYRDTFRLLLKFAEAELHRRASELALTDLAAPFVAKFLDHLESTRSNVARSRNQRLAAIRSFFRFAAVEAPQHSALIQRVLATPSKRTTRPLIDFLDRTEINALLAQPDRSTWIGRRDHALLLLAAQTGLRLSEVTGLKQQDVTLGTGAHVRCEGKGRKERATPLTKSIAATVKAWIDENGSDANARLFPSGRRTRLSADAVQHLVRKYVAAARSSCPSLARKRVTPHVLRHTAAMELLQAGVDRSLIAIWLGHESVETTQIYLAADLAMKEQILARTRPIKTAASRYQPADRLLAFLQAL